MSELTMTRTFWGDMMCFAYASQTGARLSKDEINMAQDGFEPASWQFQEGWR